jgi:hypothetical protein
MAFLAGANADDSTTLGNAIPRAGAGFRCGQRYGAVHLNNTKSMQTVFQGRQKYQFKYL